jgi:hypothetical protein
VLPLRLDAQPLRLAALAHVLKDAEPEPGHGQGGGDDGQVPANGPIPERRLAQAVHLEGELLDLLQ